MKLSLFAATIAAATAFNAPSTVAPATALAGGKADLVTLAEKGK